MGWVEFIFVFFFFQAEDGIRDLYVTGVQTCALPICDDHRDRLVVVVHARVLQQGKRAAGGRLEGRLAAVRQLRRVDRKSTRLNSSHVEISYAVFCLKKKTMKL